MLVCGNSIDYIKHQSYQLICDDTWNMLNMHQPPLTKRGKAQQHDDCQTKTNKKLNSQDVEIKLSIPFNGPLHIQSYISHLHDDVMTCKRSPHYWPFVRGIHQSTVVPLTKGQ